MEEQKAAWLKVDLKSWQSEDAHASDSEKEEKLQQAQLDVRHVLYYTHGI